MPSLAPRVLPLVLLVAALAPEPTWAQGAAGRPRDCDQCPSGPQGVQVCDEFGIPYPNGCLARCQGIAAKPCPAGASGLLPEASRVAAANVPYEVLTKHAAEGFRYVGRFRGVSDPTDDNTVTPEQLKANLAASAANPRARALPGFVRFTSDGDVYVMTKRVELPRGVTGASGSGPTSAPPDDVSALLAASSGQPQGRRLLGITQDPNKFCCLPDGRTWRPGNFQDAFHILRLSGATGCTAFLVAPNVAVTAAHCVFNYKQQVFREMWNIEVSVGSVSFGAPSISFGKIVSNYIITPQYLTTGDFAHDVAVLVLSQPLGSWWGYQGWALHDCASIANVGPVKSWGYPGVDHGQWGMQGVVVPTFTLPYGGNCAAAGVFSTTCDAQGGQSGSPIYTGTVPAVARGVLTGGFEGPSYNDANMGRSSVGTLFSGDTGTLVWWWTTWSFNQFAGK